MLSRDANSAFWIGRYIERAEAVARMIDVHYHHGLESPLVGEVLRWSSILAISGDDEYFAERYGSPTERDILHFFAFDQDNGNSIYSCVRAARENARTIRDQISSEMFECMNRFYLELRDWDVDRVLEASPHAFFQRIKDGSHLFQGITNRTLMFGEPRDFLDAGRFLERGDQTARILDVKYHDLLPRYTEDLLPITQAQELPESDPAAVGGPIDIHGWISVLKSVGAFEAFRKTYRQGLAPSLVAEFLLLNAKFPASVRHCLGRVDGCLHRISGASSTGYSNHSERVVGRLFTRLNYLSADEIIAGGMHEFLTEIQDRIAEIGEAIHADYLSF